MTAPDLSRQVEINGEKIRVYDHPSTGVSVPSVTTVINMLAKPGIAFGGYKECGKFVAANLDTLVGLKKDPAAIIDLVRFAPTRAWEGKSVRGDIVHDWIERRIKSGGTEPRDEEIDEADYRVRGTWESFREIENEYDIEWLLSETTVWSETHGYAGTLDFVAKVQGAVVLGDAKTGAGLWPEVGLQLSALHNADYALDDHGHQFDLPKIERHAALHLRPRLGRLQPVDAVNECFDGFLGLLAALTWKVQHSGKVLAQFAPKIETRSYKVNTHEERQ
jgi:hypothetical protein